MFYMNELLEMLRSLKIRDYVIIVFSLLLVLGFMNWLLTREVTPTSNAYIECLREVSIKNGYDLKSGVEKRSDRYNNVFFDSYDLSDLDYKICSDLNEDDYRLWVDETGSKRPDYFYWHTTPSSDLSKLENVNIK